MEICQLHHKAANKIIGNLSKGFRQRVGIADAILAKPEVIIMDEPTIGLDPHQIIAIRELINSLRGKMSVIISSHILPEIELICDRVMIINQGTIVASGTPESLRKDFISQDRYEVSLKSPPEEFKRVVEQIGCGLSVEKLLRASADGYFDYLLTGSVRGNLGGEIISELSKDTRFAVRTVAYRKQSLEEIFMAATRRSWEQVSNLKSASSGGGSPEKRKGNG